MTGRERDMLRLVCWFAAGSPPGCFPEAMAFPDFRSALAQVRAEGLAEPMENTAGRYGVTGAGFRWAAERHDAIPQGADILAHATYEGARLRVVARIGLDLAARAAADGAP